MSLCVLASLLFPGIASPSTAAVAKTRVWGFDLADQARIGGSAVLTLELHWGCAPTYDHLASDSLHAPRAGAIAGRRLGHTFSKHGAENTAQLLKQAAGFGRPVGQWLDNAAAERFIAERVGQLQNGARTFDLPPRLGRVVNPDGTFSAATKARLVPSGSEVKTAYPFIE